MTDKELIKQEIQRRISYLEQLGDREYIEEYFAEQFRFIEIYESLIKFINSLPEEHSVKGITWEDVNKLETLINQVHYEYPHGIGEKSFGLEVLERFQGCQYDIEEHNEDKSEKELTETYLAIFDKKYPKLPTLKGKQKADFKNFLNKCQQEFGLQEFGIHPTQSKLFKKLTLLWATWGAEHLEDLGKSNQDEFDKMSASDDLEEEITNFFSDWLLDSTQYKKLPNIARHFAEWQKQKDLEDSLKSDMTMPNKFYEKGKADVMKEMKEALQTEYEKGRFDMREELMKDAVLETEVLMDCDGDGIETPYQEWLTLEDTEIPYIPDNLGLKEGDKVKIIIVKEE